MTQDNFIGYLIGYAIAFLVGVFITRAIFSIPKFINFQRAKLHLLTEIALAQGVKPEIIKTIYAHNEVDFRPKTNEEMRVALEKTKEKAQNPSTE